MLPKKVVSVSIVEEKEGEGGRRTVASSYAGRSLAASSVWTGPVRGGLLLALRGDGSISVHIHINQGRCTRGHTERVPPQPTPRIVVEQFAGEVPCPFVGLLGRFIPWGA